MFGLGYCLFINEYSYDKYADVQRTKISPRLTHPVRLFKMHVCIWYTVWLTKAGSGQESKGNKGCVLIFKIQN